MANWRDSFKPARLSIIDGRVLFMILPTLVHIRLKTILPTLVVAGILFYFEKFRDMDVVSAARMVRSWFAGPVRRGQFRMKIRHPVDYDRFD